MAIALLQYKSILTDNKGHITNVETETVTLPNESIEGVVSGVKGAKETLYRNGNVNLTPQNIGALPEDGNAATATKAQQDASGRNIVDTYLEKTGDTGGNTVTFTSGDSVSAAGWSDIPVLSSGERHSSILEKLSTMLKMSVIFIRVRQTVIIHMHGGLFRELPLHFRRHRIHMIISR